MDDQSLFAPVAELYEAVLDPDRLRALAPIVWQSVGADIGSVMIVEQAGGRVLGLPAATENFDAAAHAEYSEHYCSTNPWVRSALRLRPPYVVRGAELVDDRTFARSEFCADWCSRTGIFHLLGGMHPIGGGAVAMTGAYRARSAGAFSETEKTRFAQVARHVAQVLRLAERFSGLAGERQLGLDLIEALDLGVILLDAQARPIFANRVADRVLISGAWLTASAGRVRPVRRAEERAFDDLVSATVRTGSGTGLAPGGVVRLEDAAGVGLPVLVAPMRLGTTGHAGGSAVVLVFSDPAAHRLLDARRIAAALGLSPTEGAVVAALVEGKALARYAEEAGVSVNTAKSQLAAIFDKTGQSRQAGLVAATLAHSALRLAPLS